MTAPEATLESVLTLVAATGWRIFPSVDKQPAIRDWPNACSREPAVIRRWWQRWPEASPSLVTGPRNGIVVLDIDVGTDRTTGLAYSGFDSLETHFHWVTMPQTPCVHTRRGGAHLYFACPRLPDEAILSDRHPAHSTAIKNSVSILAPHIDVRGWNGQVVLPAEGSGYTIDPALDFSLPMLPAPGWFNHRPKRTQRQPDHFDHERFSPDTVVREACNRIARAPEGTRHDTYRHETFRIARLVGLGLIEARAAYHDLAAECHALGLVADGDTRRTDKYFRQSWEEGLAAARERRR